MRTFVQKLTFLKEVFPIILKESKSWEVSYVTSSRERLKRI